jgi:hypothetical protein
MGHEPDLGAFCGPRDQPRQRIHEIGMQAGLGLVQGDERRQAVSEQGAREGEVAQGAVRQFRRIEDPDGDVGKAQAEAGVTARLGDDEPRTREGGVDGLVDLGGVLPDMRQGGEDGGEVRAVRGQRRRRHREAWPA